MPPVLIFLQKPISLPNKLKDAIKNSIRRIKVSKSTFLFDFENKMAACHFPGVPTVNNMLKLNQVCNGCFHPKNVVVHNCKKPIFCGKLADTSATSIFPSA